MNNIFNRYVDLKLMYSFNDNGIFYNCKIIILEPVLKKNNTSYYHLKFLSTHSKIYKLFI